MNLRATGVTEVLIILAAMVAGAVFIVVAFELGMAARPKEMRVWGSTEAAAISSPSSSSSSSTAASTSPSTSSASSGSVDGKAVFDKNCSGCHPGGNKGVGPALNTADFKQRYSQDSVLSDMIRKGKGGMPGFSAAQVSDSDLKALVTYIKSLN